MAFDIDCSCGAKVRIREEALSEPVRCGACGIEFEVMPVGEVETGAVQPSDLVEFECVCGAPAKLPVAELGSHFHCDRCGVEMPIVGGASASEPWISEPASDAAAPGDADSTLLRCPACGGQAEITYQGPQGRDRVLVCRFCGTASDLPEARGITREKVIERPGQTIRESVTRWVGTAPEAGVPAPSGEERVSERVFVEEQTFPLESGGPTSEDALASRLREVLPADVASRLLGELRGGSEAPRPGADGKPGVLEHVRIEVETSGDGPDGASDEGFWKRVLGRRRPR